MHAGAGAASRSGDPMLAELRELSFEGWSAPEPLTEHGVWCVRRGTHSLYTRASEQWVELALDTGPFDALGGSAGPRPPQAALYRRALEVSQTRFLCKYALDDAGRLILRVELPAEALERASIACAIRALLAAADTPLEGPEKAVDRPGAKPTLDEKEYEIVSESTLFTHFKMLNNKGWVYKERLAPNHWRALQNGHERSLDIFLSFNGSWAYFQTPMLIAPRPFHSPLTPGEALLCEFVLRANETMQWAKFGVDEEGQVLLGVEMPLAMFDFRRFRAAARAVEHYTTAMFYEVQMLAELDRDPILKRLLLVPGGKQPVANVMA